MKVCVFKKLQQSLKMNQISKCVTNKYLEAHIWCQMHLNGQNTQISKIYIRIAIIYPYSPFVKINL